MQGVIDGFNLKKWMLIEGTRIYMNLDLCMFHSCNVSGVLITYLLKHPIRGIMNF